MSIKESVKELLEKVKAKFNAPVAPVVAPVVAADPDAAPPAPVGKAFKLKDGSEVSIVLADPAGINPAVGDAVSINGAPAAAGDYEFEDGSKITVDEVGKISAVTPVEPATQNPEELAAAPSIEERLAAIEQELAKMKAPATYATAEQFSAVETKFAEAQQKIAKQDDVIKGLFDLCDELVKTPTAEPTTLTATQKEKFDKQDKRDKRIQEMADAYEKLKNKNKNPVNA